MTLLPGPALLPTNPPSPQVTPLGGTTKPYHKGKVFVIICRISVAETASERKATGQRSRITAPMEYDPEAVKGTK